MAKIKIKMYGGFVLLVFFLLLFGCVKENDGGNNYNTNLGDSSTEKNDVAWENGGVGQGKMAGQYNDEEEVGPKFREIKKEIDYWSAKGPKQIGQEHYDQLMGRLNEVKGRVSEVERAEYIARLNAIELIKNTGSQNIFWGKSGEKSDGKTVGQIAGQNGNVTGHAKQKLIISNCEGEGSVMFTHAPMKLDEIEMIQPTGLMIGGHVTPIDHGYYSGKKWKTVDNRRAEEFVDVYAPAAGFIEVQTMPEVYASSSVGDYRLVIYHSCTFYSIFIHVNQLPEKLQKVVAKGPIVKVEAGEVIGRAPGFDFSVHDEEVTLPGFVVLDSYDAEPFKLHTVDMFDVFVEPLRTELLARNVRQAQPRGGKIDYDIDGKLVGNWFEEWTNAYFGKKEFNRLLGYWQTHAAFAYDALDPSLVVVSLGDFGGEARQFAVKGNSPNPATVGVGSGVVTYELVKYDYKTESGENWDRWHFAKIGKAYAGNEVQGVVLVEMVDNRKMKMEWFVGGSASTVKGFSGKEKVYVR
ncbi:MAG: hypothetical protein A2912_05820 [Candidatus Buchananbacteria bacterium RIFCSPLOWO2_01_FULL_40_23b]|uniref:Peptidase M23 domain-containing protein n=1 Tax=Candidatus Buchananbacteria bacterium RIFCSPLOWO2_01_FULL_40_23b TaxID=1797544 RepID=A0A1G1YT32_9BACT|nr:MAG: hypothetical protein A2912_05820 [Candidatus Buchananbacteria bacterium RIFCSPLOWO2_01_FULL_40_23b]